MNIANLIAAFLTCSPLTDAGDMADCYADYADNVLPAAPAGFISWLRDVIRG